MDNKSILSQLISEQIDPNGPDGSILAQNHRDRLIEVLTKAGKYNGLYFVCQLNRVEFPSGVMSWNGFSLDSTDSNFNITVSRKSSDLNDIGVVLKTLGGATQVQFKDFEGRSAFYKFLKFEEDEIDGNNVYRIFLKSLPENPSFVYQPTQTNICSLTFNANMNKICDYGDLRIFKNESNNDPNIIEPGDTIIGQLTNNIFLNRGTYVSGDPLLIDSYDDFSDFFDPNN